MTFLARASWLSAALLGTCLGFFGCGSSASAPEGGGGNGPLTGPPSSAGAGPSLGGAGAGGAPGGITPQGGVGASAGTTLGGGSSGGSASAGGPGAPAAGTPGTSGAASGGAPGNGAAGAASVAGAASGGSSAGASGSAASAGGGSGGSGTPGNGFLTENFENGTVGQQPAGWDNFVGWVKNGNNSPSGQTYAVVDDSNKHGGSKSVHFKGGSQPAMITRPLPSGTNKLYVRAWVYMTRQLGQNPGANHETLIGIRKESGGANDEVRFGEIKGVIGTNEVPSDNISPKMDLWGKGPVVPKNTWVCLEVAFLGDEAQHKLHAWADGTLIHEVTAGDQWQNGTMPATWLNGKFVEVILGWHSFSSQEVEVWMDDLVLATSRVGCD